MVTYLENIMEYRKKLLILICEFSKLARRIHSIQLYFCILTMKNGKLKKQCQNMKYFGVNMIRYVSNIYTGNYKTLLKAI